MEVLFESLATLIDVITFLLIAFAVIIFLAAQS